MNYKKLSSYIGWEGYKLGKGNVGKTKTDLSGQKGDISEGQKSQDGGRYNVFKDQSPFVSDPLCDRRKEEYVFNLTITCAVLTLFAYLYIWT